ncbi:hypothetical protein QA648_36660 (plasmid) [Rhizobium sp. CB3171]|uniref:hypothetical protein n=1 Tax=Rhizobium sp. CB3171 TaxID=3039157 RepID=UPI0024B0E0A7|nr:hypothetical protein [Rhizobium sp. CB3171]WFU07459.1 hypothetical protein QA648_36660 [Rhizobium sp. CB3171]
MGSKLYLVMIAYSVAMVANAADCDFGRPIGKCTPTITLERAYGSAPSYGAELLVRSSARNCSKVEYFVNSTPYETVLKNKNADTESLFGTKPVSSRDIRISGCTAYANKSDSSSHGAAPATGMVASGFSGHWAGQVRWLFVADPADIVISTRGSTVTGTWHDGKSGFNTPFSGSVNGNTLTFNYVAQGDGSHGTATMTMTGQNTATIRFAAAPATFSGALTRSP